MKIDLRRIAEATDPIKETDIMLGDSVDKITVTRNRILVSIYVEPARTKGGIIRPDRTLDEGRFQGKCGRVLKMGPIAFKFDEAPEETVIPKIGDWIFYRASDTWEVGLGLGVPCRFVYDGDVVGVISDPSIIW